jgi:5,6-dimethylbenzimidazole synthase
VKELFVDANIKASARYAGVKGALYRQLKLEGIEEAPINLCITCSRRRGGPHVLGRSTVRATDLYSTCCAVQNLWLAARAEGIGVGWVSILDHHALKQVVGVPESVTILAYLCLGYVSKFEQAPDLETAGWRERIPVDQLIHYEAWGNQSSDKGSNGHADYQGLYKNGRRGKNQTRRRATGVEGQSSSRGVRHRR